MTSKRRLERRWLALELSAPHPFREAISSFLFDEGATGLEEVSQDSRWQTIKAYLPRDERERKFIFALRRYLRSLQKIFPRRFRYRIKITSIPEKDWGEGWKKHFRPIRVTPRIVVKPPWSSVRLKRGEVSIDIPPGMAFGTGTHATTRLSIQALEKRLQRKGLTVLDLGTGSGILAIVAAKLGATEVWGLDLDALSVEAAERNVVWNGVSSVVRIRKGSIGSVRKKFQVIVANIDFKVLRRLRWPLIRHLRPPGYLILSGILVRDARELRCSYLDTGELLTLEEIHEEEWACITFQKKRPR